ncbi:hypothetical protein ABZZ74_50565 [Streptomyces sp. NPDC006476]|uniref:hypothetical protein n=1 Tax=Streptomyces sp. NPDC006476 TaxID=3157175 RepID=UPI0033A2A170
MKTRNRVALAMTTGVTAVGLALAAPAAQADIAAAYHPVVAHSVSAPLQAQGTWHTIWQSKFKPRHSKWVSQPFGVHDGVISLSVKYQCWNGGDGTKMTVKLIDTHNLNKTVKKSRAYCNGAWHAFQTEDVTPSTRYKIVTQQDHGRTHTEQVGVYEED